MAASNHGDGSALPVAGLVIGERYAVSRHLGSGSFGQIYMGFDTVSREHIAVKIESPSVKAPQLINENDALNRMHGGVGVPRVKWFGNIGDHGTAMVMDLLGPSLEDLFNFCERRFSNKTILMLADQMINRVEFVHTRCFLHRDIKPDNFLMGNNRYSATVFIVDFGLAKRYMTDGDKTSHVPLLQGHMLIGTARYASINSHLGIEQSRRDDVAALGYLFMYFCRGVLPWMNMKASNRRQKYDRICRCKMDTSVADLTRGFSAEYAMYIEYCRRLRFTEQPDYAYLRQLFRALSRRLNIQYDFYFDWNKHKPSTRDRT